MKGVDVIHYLRARFLHQCTSVPPATTYPAGFSFWGCCHNCKLEFILTGLLFKWERKSIQILGKGYRNNTEKKTKTKTLQIQEDLHTNSKHLPAMEKMCFLHNLYTAFPLIPSKNYILVYITWYHVSFKIFSLFTLNQMIPVFIISYLHKLLLRKFQYFSPGPLFSYFCHMPGSMSPCLHGESHGKYLSWEVQMLE